MKKWLFIGLVIVALFIWQTVEVYQSAQAEKDQGTSIARNKATSLYHIKHINQITYYHGQEAYHVVNADLKDGRHVYIWIPDNEKTGHDLMLPVSDGYSKNEILKAFSDHVSYKKIISTRLGMEDGKPAWEITYIDSDGGYVFSYYDFETGESIIDPISIK